MKPETKNEVTTACESVRDDKAYGGYRREYIVKFEGHPIAYFSCGDSSVQHAKAIRKQVKDPEFADWLRHKS